MKFNREQVAVFSSIVALNLRSFTSQEEKNGRIDVRPRKEFIFSWITCSPIMANRTRHNTMFVLGEPIMNKWASFPTSKIIVQSQDTLHSVVARDGRFNSTFEKYLFNLQSGGKWSRFVWTKSNLNSWVSLYFQCPRWSTSGLLGFGCSQAVWSFHHRSISSCQTYPISLMRLRHFICLLAASNQWANCIWFGRIWSRSPFYSIQYK